MQCLDDARGTLFLASDALVPTETPRSEFFSRRVTDCSGRKSVEKRFRSGVREPNVMVVDYETRLRNHGHESSSASCTAGKSKIGAQNRGLPHGDISEKAKTAVLLRKHIVDTSPLSLHDER